MSSIESNAPPKSSEAAAETTPGASPAAPPPAVTPLSWPETVSRLWAPALLIVLGWSFALSTFWQLRYLPLVYDLVLRAEDGGVRSAQAEPRKLAAKLLLAVLVGAGLHIVVVLRQIRNKTYKRVPYGYWLAIASVGLPVLCLPVFEYEHAFLAGVSVLMLSTAVAYVGACFARDRKLTLPEPSQRTAWLLVSGSFVLFLAVIGFLSHRRASAFYAHPYDYSWELNAVAGILRHGIPTISTGADSYYPGKHLPAPYFNLHAPGIYYLYAPFYALWKDPRTVVWLQAALMGSGVFGAYMAGRRWFMHRGLAVLAAFAYALNPQVQSYCLHDIHANICAIPLMLLAVGFMEAKRPRWAIAMALLVAICREETGIYAAAVGLFWLLGKFDRVRFRAGLVTVVASAAIYVLMTAVLMPAFGGEPRMGRHFSLFFDSSGPDGFVRVLLLNPFGVFDSMLSPVRTEYAWLSFIPMGLVALLGWRAAWFLLPTLPLLLASGNPDFYSNGINYGAPITPPAILMGMMGIRSLLLSKSVRNAWGRHRQLPILLFVGSAALGCNILYGNIASKTYKLEYGNHPVRENEYRYHGNLGCLSEVPPFGKRERGIWEAIHRVPKDAIVSTSWLLNPQLSDHDVAYVYPYLGQSNEPEQRPNYIILDKLPPMIEPTDRYIEELHKNNQWQVEFENDYAALFKRRGAT
ncbi:MAG: DUF2079 domain-containing protein [Myxococcales bacterium]